MFELKIENIKGQLLKLTQNESNYRIISITGLNPPSAEINTIKSANRDGSIFNSSFLSERNVVITLALSGDIERNRIRIYEFLGTGNYCKIYFSNGLRDVYCEGHVEQIENDIFSKNQEIQISILCEDPYLYALNQIYVDISKTFNNFEFPFSIESEGKEISIRDINRITEIVNTGNSTGIEMTLTVITEGVSVENPVIYNAKTGEFFKINTELNYGEKILINTTKGKKLIKKNVNGVDHNIINQLELGSTWHQLKEGHNAYAYSSDTNQGLLHIDFNYNIIYKGV